MYLAELHTGANIMFIKIQQRPGAAGVHIFDNFNVLLAQKKHHYNYVIMIVMASQITNLTIVHSTVYSGADHRKHQRSASLAFVRGVHRWPLKFPSQWSSNAENVSIDDVIKYIYMCVCVCVCRPLTIQFMLPGVCGTNHQHLIGVHAD